MSPLKFTILSCKSEAGSTARRGTLLIADHKRPKAGTRDDEIRLNETRQKRTIETPGCFMHSIKGSVPHLTPDTMRLQNFGGIDVSLEQLLQTDQPASFDSKWPSPTFTLADYLNLQDLILLCDLRDLSYSTPSLSPSSSSVAGASTKKVGPNTDRHVLLSTPKGIRPLTLEDYLKVARQFRPDILVALADNITENNIKPNLHKSNRGKEEANQKRVRKSVDRTLKWLDQILLEREGRDGMVEDRKADEEKKRRKDNREKRRALSKEQQEQQRSDAVKDDTPIEVEEVSTAPWMDVSVFAHVQGSQFEEERIRSAEESGKRVGVDGFLVDAGHLMTAYNKEEMLRQVKTSVDHLPLDKPKMVYGIQAPEDVLKAVSMGVDLFDTSYPYQLTEDGKASLYYFGLIGKTSASSAASVASKLANGTNRWINLWDEEHGDKFVPLLEGCECYACKGGRHTRAYINHLLKTHEMLATVLLMSHNMYQYSKFFEAVREAVAFGTLDQYSKVFEETFGTEPARSSEKHEAQIAVEAALTKRNQRLEVAEPCVVDAIDSKKRPEGEAEEKDSKKIRKDEVDNTSKETAA